VRHAVPGTLSAYPSQSLPILGPGDTAIKVSRLVTAVNVCVEKSKKHLYSQLTMTVTMENGKLESQPPATVTVLQQVRHTLFVCFLFGFQLTVFSRRSQRVVMCAFYI